MTPRTPRRRRWLKLAVALAVVLVAVVISLVVVAVRVARQALPMALDDLDATDPRWTLAAIAVDRPQVSDDDNSALLIRTLGGRLGDTRPAERAAGWAVPNDYGSRLAPRFRALFATLLPPAADLRDAAHDLADRPQGRFPAAWDGNPFAAAMGVPLLDMIAVERYLDLSVLDHADRGDRDAAVRAWRAHWNVSRSLAHEPTRMLCAVRLNHRDGACRQVEWLLDRRAWTDHQLLPLGVSPDSPAAFDALRLELLSSY